MIIPVKCFTCGKVIGNKWEAYKKACAELEENTKQSKSYMHADLVDNFDKNLKGKILDDLGLPRICCRRHLLAHIDLVDII
jgi:DNA-directed RNA polymerase subunit N (RpoN/RPB10)